MDPTNLLTQLIQEASQQYISDQFSLAWEILQKAEKLAIDHRLTDSDHYQELILFQRILHNIMIYDH